MVASDGTSSGWWQRDWRCQRWLVAGLVVTERRTRGVNHRSKGLQKEFATTKRQRQVPTPLPPLSFSCSMQWSEWNRILG
ncbi:hypothetical protein GYH30_023987 [Glycine max]|nr:hypothetical protein GYH30_023987 [Glycine max]